MTAAGSFTPWETRDATSEKAAKLFAQRRFGNWSETDEAELDAWLREATSHYVAYLRIEAIAARTDRLSTVHSFGFERAAANSCASTAGPLNYRRIWLPLLAAASIAVFATLAAPYVMSLLEPPDRIYSTNVGGRALLSFADRTQIELNTDTIVRYRMTSNERTVWLEKGEAWFHVAHDAAHPFTVVVGRHKITDLGTEFLVHRGAGDVEVVLLNGRAALSTEGAQTAALRPGDDAVATAVSMSVMHRSSQELADALAWRRGMLVFRNTRLADVIREFNRYNTTKLILAAPSIENVKVTAELKADDYVAFLNLAQTMLSLHADREGNNIVISRAVSRMKRAVHSNHGK